MSTSPSGSQADAALEQGSRPYRSHRYPACDICRRRKTRCIRNLNDRACQFCRQHDLGCEVSISNTNANESRTRRVGRSRQTQHPRQSPVTQGPAPHEPPGFVFDDTLLNTASGMTSPAQPEGADSSQNEDSNLRGDAHTHSGHIIGPVAAPDVQILEQHMSPSTALPVSHARPNPYTVYSNDFRNPIVYLKVPRHRVPSSKGNGTAGFRQYECVEKMLEPHGADVVDL